MLIEIVTWKELEHSKEKNERKLRGRGTGTGELESVMKEKSERR